ncbi:hypothetical protein D3C76_1738140 [compost metagenome]
MFSAPSITPVCRALKISPVSMAIPLPPMALMVSMNIGLPCTRIFMPLRSSRLRTGFLV